MVNQDPVADDNELVPDEIERLVSYSSNCFSILISESSPSSHKISRLLHVKTLSPFSRHLSALTFVDSGGRICSLTKVTDLGTFRAVWIPKESPSNFPGLTLGTWLIQ